MNAVKLGVLIVLLVACVLLALGYVPIPRYEPQGSGAQASGSQSQSGVPSLTRSGAADGSAHSPLTLEPEAELDAIDRYEAGVLAMLSERKFDRLEATASDLRSTKKRFPGGPWKLHKLYNGVAMPDGGSGVSDSCWQGHLALLKEWMRQKSDSVTPCIALGGALVNYAWKARGNGFANTVTDEGWSMFQQRLEEAQTVLARVGEKRKTDPHWYLVMETLARGQGWDRKAFDKLFEEGVAVEPLYYYLYQDKAEYLLPRWYGEPGEWQNFADQATRRIGGQQGSALYFLIVDSVHRYYRTNVYSEANLSWQRVRQGYFDLVNLYGTDAHNMNEIIVLAGMAGDRTLAHEMYGKIGDRWDPQSWRNKDLFDQWRRWAAGTN